MTDVYEPLNHALLALCRAGAYDSWSEGPHVADVSRQEYREATERVTHLAGDLE